MPEIGRRGLVVGGGAVAAAALLAALLAPGRKPDDMDAARARAGGGAVAAAALLAALLAPGRQPEGMDAARAQAGVERIEAAGTEPARCLATWGTKRHDGCYLSGALRVVAEQRAETPEWKAAQWVAEAEAYAAAAGCGPLPDPDGPECATSPFCRGDACAPRDGR